MISRIVEMFGHRHCKKELHRLMQSALNDSKKIDTLNSQIIGLLNQVQELKAVNDYQTFELEQKVASLEAEHGKLKNIKPKNS